MRDRISGLMSTSQHSDETSVPVKNTVATPSHVLPWTKQTADLEAREFAEAVIATVPNPLLVLDANLTIATANDAFFHHFQVSPSETVGQPIWLLGNGQWNIPSLRRLLSDVLPRNSSVVNYEVNHHFPSIGMRIMLLNGRTVL